MFGSCIIHILYPGCAKIKKIIPAPKGQGTDGTDCYTGCLCAVPTLSSDSMTTGLFADYVYTLAEWLIFPHTAGSSIGKRKGNSTRLFVKSASVLHTCCLYNSQHTAVSKVTGCELGYPGFEPRNQHIFLFFPQVHPAYSVWTGVLSRVSIDRSVELTKLRDTP